MTKKEEYPPIEAGEVLMKHLNHITEYLKEKKTKEAGIYYGSLNKDVRAIVREYMTKDENFREIAYGTEPEKKK